MHKNGRPVRITPVANIAEVNTHQNRANCLNLRLTEVKEGKRYHLDEYAEFTEFLLQTEKHETPEDEFPGEHIYNNFPGVFQQAEFFNGVIRWQRRISGRNN